MGLGFRVQELSSEKMCGHLPLIPTTRRQENQGPFLFIVAVGSRNERANGTPISVMACLRSWQT